MELVILDDGFIFIFVFAEIVHPPHKLLVLINNSHFLVLNGFWAYLIIHDVIDVPEEVDILGVKILMVQGVIDENLERRL